MRTRNVILSGIALLLLSCSAPALLKRATKGRSPGDAAGSKSSDPNASGVDPNAKDVKDLGVPESDICQATAPTGAGSVSPPPAAGSPVLLKGAGRVRIRHENEKLYGLFPNFYWENRSFGFEVEDRSSVNETILKFTYLPVAPQASDPLPNLRVFYTGTGNIFQLNELMVKQGDAYTFTVNDGRIKKGAIVEFEFGIFIDRAFIRSRDKDGVTAGDTNYYTDTFRYLVGEGKLLGAGASSDPAAYAGGDTTIGPVVAEPDTAFSQVALNVQKDTIEKFLRGRALFHTNFQTGKHSENDKTFMPEMIDRHNGQLGPLFNAQSCSECHVKNGRSGPPQDAGEALSTMVLRTALNEGGASSKTIHPVVGQQLNQLAVDGMEPEGKAYVRYESVNVPLADGSSQSLRRPVYELKLAGDKASSDVDYSPRVARQIVGMGLLEAVDLASVVANAKVQCDNPARTISGRLNRVTNPASGQIEWGRFGWKGAKASVAHQVAQALHLDLDVTTELFPNGQCVGSGCKAETPVEVNKEALDELTTYVQMLGVPPRRQPDEAKVKKGEALFLALGCSGCHMPSLTTRGDHPLGELRNQTIHPYTDLLLHDMGPDLADRVGEGEAEGSEWRTPPLWGLGLLKDVNGSLSLLHDGRARSVVEAVLWHGGEAAPVKDNFVKLSAEEREALAAFVGSL